MLASLDMTYFLEQSVRDYRKWWLQGSLDLYLPQSVDGSTESTESAAPLAKKRCIYGSKRLRVVNRRMLPRYMMVALCVNHRNLPGIAALLIQQYLDIGPRALRRDFIFNTSRDLIFDTISEVPRVPFLSSAISEVPRYERGRLGREQGRLARERITAILAKF